MASIEDATSVSYASLQRQFQQEGNIRTKPISLHGTPLATLCQHSILTL